MKKGVCVKCGLPAVCTAEMGFQQAGYVLKMGDSMFSDIAYIKSRNYICTECGYHEQYIVETESLEKIAELAANNIRGWTRVPLS